MFNKAIEGGVAGFINGQNLLAAVFFFIILSISAEAANTQGHPFSQIYYIDTNFNMSGYNITNTGYVGVGTTVPSYPLDVSGIGRIAGNLYVGGNLGIGTISPSNTLNVIGDVNATGAIYGRLGSPDSVNTTAIADLAVTDAKISEVNWTKLNGYPAACAPNQAVRAINDTDFTCVDINTGGNVSGSGDTDYLPVWTGVGTLGNSFVSQSGGLLYAAAGIVFGGNIDMQNSYGLINATFVNATNIYAGGNAVLTAETMFGGNVTGNSASIQLAPGSVGNSQILNGSITSAKLAPDLNLGWANLTNYPSDCSAGQVATGFNDTQLICTSAGTGDILGTGDPNYLAKFTLAKTLGSSSMYEENGLVGIGVAVSLTDPLNINSSASGSSIALIGRAFDNKSSISFLDSARVSDISLQRNGNALGIIGGNVGVGTTTPQSSFEIVGTFNASSNNSTLILNSEGDVMVGV